MPDQLFIIHSSLGHGRMIILDLPYPPSINHYYSYQRGRPVLSKHARSYRQLVRAEVIKQRVKPVLGPLAVRIEIHPPDLRRRDCDNVQKSLLDALQHAGVFWDDSQIVWLLTIKASAVPDGSTTVVLDKFSDDLFAGADSNSDGFVDELRRYDGRV